MTAVNRPCSHLSNPPDLICTELQKDWKLVEEKQYACKWSGNGMGMGKVAWHRDGMGMGIVAWHRDGMGMGIVAWHKDGMGME